MRISVFSSPELQAAILALKGMERSIATQTRRAIKSITQDEWQRAVLGGTTRAAEVRVLGDTARVAVSNQNITLKSATVGRSLAGGYKPSQLARGYEFGSNRDRVATYKAHRGGKEFTVTRHTTRQFPTIRKSGPVYGAAAQVIPRFAALFVQTVVRTFYEAIEGKAS